MISKLQNSAQNAPKVAIFRLKIETISGEGALPLTPLGGVGASILAPAARDHSAPSTPRFSRLRRSTLAPCLQILDPPLHSSLKIDNHH